MKIQLQSHMYTVQSDYDSEGAVQAFRLLNSAGHIVFETDYVCDTLTVAHIDEELSQSARFLRDPILQKLYPVVEHHTVHDRPTLPGDTTSVSSVAIFDTVFPQYVDRPLEQRTEACEIFESVADESMAFQKLCVEEYFELHE